MKQRRPNVIEEMFFDLFVIIYIGITSLNQIEQSIQKLIDINLLSRIVIVFFLYGRIHIDSKQKTIYFNLLQAKNSKNDEFGWNLLKSFGCFASVLLYLHTHRDRHCIGPVPMPNTTT